MTKAPKVRTVNGPRVRVGSVSAILVAVFCAVACSRGVEPMPTAPPAAPPPAPSPAAAPVQAEPMTPAAAPPFEHATGELDDERKEKAPSGNFAEPPPDDLANAEAELERARAELNHALAGSPPHSTAPRSADAASRGAGAAAPPRAKDEKSSDETSCSTACHAFSSLERAASAVCRLTGEKDGRCGHAHAVVAEAQKRVAVCSCAPE